MRREKQIVAKPTPITYERKEFTREMFKEGYTILAPQMSPIHFALLEPVFHSHDGFRLTVRELNQHQRTDIFANGLIVCADGFALGIGEVEQIIVVIGDFHTVRDTLIHIEGLGNQASVDNIQFINLEIFVAFVLFGGGADTHDVLCRERINDGTSLGGIVGMLLVNDDDECDTLAVGISNAVKQILALTVPVGDDVHEAVQVLTGIPEAHAPARAGFIIGGGAAHVEGDADADNDIVIDEPEKSEEAESEESEKDEAPAEAVESDAKDSATDELITAFANEPEFSEETATPDEIVANDILKQSFETDDTYDPMAAAEEPASDSDDSDDDTAENGFVINVHAIKHHITPDEIEATDTDEDMETPANVDAFLNDDDDDEDDNDSHTHHSRFRGFFKK